MNKPKEVERCTRQDIEYKPLYFVFYDIDMSKYGVKVKDGVDYFTHFNEAWKQAKQMKKIDTTNPK